MGGKVLSAASLQKMTTPFKNDYASGLRCTRSNGHKVIQHNGGIEGFNTAFAYYPDDKLTVVVLANLSGQAPDSIAGNLAALAHGEKVVLSSERKEITVSPAILEKYVGTYELMPNFDIVMTLEDGQLMTQATGQSKFPMFAESETKFFLKVVDAEVEFFKNDKGEVTLPHPPPGRTRREGHQKIDCWWPISAKQRLAENHHSWLRSANFDRIRADRPRCIRLVPL